MRFQTRFMRVALLLALVPTALPFRPTHLPLPRHGLSAVPRPRREFLRMVSIVPRRAFFSKAAAAGFGALAGVSVPNAAHAIISKDAEWPLWPALPVAPYSKRKTLRREAGPNVWVFDQFLGIYCKIGPEC